ncbi:MAG: hypothetical protein AB1830_13000 [Pseudomonadota bacterium]
MKPPFRLVGEMVSHDTVEVLTDLLKLARQGEVIGLAAVAVYKRRTYEFAITGEASRSPTFALGAITKLQFDIAQKVNLG